MIDAKKKVLVRFSVIALILVPYLVVVSAGNVSEHAEPLIVVVSIHPAILI